MVSPQGLPMDREWMLVDENGTFLSQRSNPNLALFSCQLESNELYVSHDGDEIHIPRDVSDDQEYVEVSVWQSEVLAATTNQGIDKWFSERLNQKVRLVSIGKTCQEVS
jgi:uncharacterized protein YcbX